MDHPSEALNLVSLQQEDKAIYDLILEEQQRQSRQLELIASENFVHPAILQAVGSILTNKYAEGVAKKRYYGGCEVVDEVEQLACKRACELFGAQYANVQPHSGTQANMAILMEVLQPGDSFLAMDLDAGGHLTHGSPVSFSGRIYQAIAYGVRPEDELLDYDDMLAKARQHKPKLIIAGASSYSRQINFQRFHEAAQEVGAKLLVDMAHIAGLVAADLHPSPVPLADFVTSTTHKTLRGPRGGLILAKSESAKALDTSVCPRIQGGPLMHVIAAKATCFYLAMQPSFKRYQQAIINNTKALAAVLQSHGFRLVSGGTDNHLLLLDLRPQGMTGKHAETILDKAGITTNKNKIPFDPQSPWITSGLRMGTAALTTRGMGEEQMQHIAWLVSRVLHGSGDPEIHRQIRQEVEQLTAQYPLYAPMWSESV